MTDLESWRATAKSRIGAVGWSQSEWGRQAGAVLGTPVNPKTISEILSGKTRSPEPRTIHALETVLAEEESRRGTGDHAGTGRGYLVILDEEEAAKYTDAQLEEFRAAALLAVRTRQREIDSHT